MIFFFFLQWWFRRTVGVSPEPSSSTLTVIKPVVKTHMWCPHRNINWGWYDLPALLPHLLVVLEVTNNNWSQYTTNSLFFFFPSFLFSILPSILDFSFWSMVEHIYHYLPGVTFQEGIKILSSGCHGEWLWVTWLSHHIPLFFIPSKTGAIFYNMFAKSLKTFNSHWK